MMKSSLPPVHPQISTPTPINPTTSSPRSPSSSSLILTPGQRGPTTLGPVWGPQGLAEGVGCHCPSTLRLMQSMRRHAVWWLPWRGRGHRTHSSTERPTVTSTVCKYLFKQVLMHSLYLRKKKFRGDIC